MVERSMVLVLCLAALPSAAYGQSLRDRLVGTWTLVSWGTLSGGVEVPVPMSKGGTGIITYSPDGYVCVSIMGPDRPKFASPDFTGGSVDEKAAAFETFVGYCGRYEVNEEERFVTHTLQTSWYPNWTG
ncbi:MAG TPA: lipocalin-like domain-containing protein, partial [Burkholderiales bacterium]|nr:lipocalin-like domain-containing protein [Burkholderiales bacterium]